MPTSSGKILVTGASGNFGGLVLTHLTQTYHVPSSQIIATTRNPDHLSAWSDQGVEVRKADFGEPESLVDAFQGVSKVLFVSADSVDNEVRLKQHLAAVEAFKAAGVPHIFYTSMPQAEDSLISLSSVHFGTEQAIKASGAKWTILRNSWYCENVVPMLSGAISSGTIYTAAVEGKISYISRSEQAHAAAAALVAVPSPENTTFTITGAQGLTIGSVVAAATELFGKPIVIVQVSVEGVVQGAMEHGLPKSIAEMLASFDAATKAGQLELVTDDYEKLTGLKPTSFKDWLKENQSLFVPKG
jgi:NAD(P)H dehydrogenase (quinone)